MKKGHAIVGFLVLAASLATAWFFEGGDSKRSGADVDSKSGLSSVPTTLPVIEDAGSTSLARSPLLDALESAPTTLAVRVQGADQSPISNARVFAAGLTLEDSEAKAPWPDFDPWPDFEWDSSGPEPLVGTTSTEGLHVFDAPPMAPHGLVLWASHPEYEAGCAVLGVDREAWPSEVRITLTPASAIEVVVLDRDRVPISGARVEQYGTTSSDATLEPGMLSVARARRRLHTTETTGTDGVARFGPLPGRQVFCASRGKELSVPWQGTAQKRVVLTLRSTFELSGRISLPDDESSALASRRILIAAQDRNLWRTLHTLHSIEDGAFGPVVLPKIDVDRYRVRFEGTPFIPVEEFFDPPAAGTRVNVDLVATIGVPVSFRVADEDEEVIPEAVVKVKWQDSHHADHWNFAERRDDGSGRVTLNSLPPGSMMYEAHAKGYVSFYSGLESTSTSEGSFTRINLNPAGRLTGRCTRGGVPVQDFEVLVWREVGTTPQSRSFFDREDGSFELDTVPTGTFWVSASTVDHPGGEPVSVDCPKGGIAEVVIDLPESVVGYGLIVDERTHAPLTDAAIQVFVPASPVPIARWGLPIPVEADGTFELAVFLAGTNHVRASASGYSSKIATQTTANGDLDFGTVALSRAQPLRITLQRADPSIAVLVSGRGSFVLENKEFGPDGTVVYENVNAGGYALRFDQGNYEDTVVEVDLVPGEDWMVEERIDGPNHLTVECQLPDGRPYPDRFQVTASYLSSQGLRHQRNSLSAQGAAKFMGIDASSVSVLVLDWNGNEIGAGGGTFSTGDLHLAIPIGGDPFDLRVVDGDGQPLSTVRVMLLNPRLPGMTLFGSTTEDGKCRLVGVPEHEVFVHLQHSTGSRFGVPVDASIRTAELVLDPSASIRLAFQDGELPLEGVGCAVIDESRVSLTPIAFSDASGLVTIPALATGPYRILATRSDCWAVEANVEARPDRPPTGLQMRRLADLALEVVTLEGLPVAGLVVDLESVEFGTSVARWLSENRVRSTGFVTDAQGAVRVERVPRGGYLWRFDILGSQLLEGEISASPESAAPFRIVLPE